MACGLNFTSQPIIKEGKDSLATLKTKITYTYPQNTCVFQVEVAEKRAFFR
jgi:hypothetical protein